MTDILATLLAIGILFVAVPVLLLWIWDMSTRTSPAQRDADSHAFLERLRRPDYTALQDHFGRPLPDALRSLYENKEEVVRQDFEMAPSLQADEDQRWYIAFYQPADAQAVRDAWPGCEECFAFANDGSGNDYLVDPRVPDPPVRFHDHETGEFTPVCDQVSEFLNWQRIPVAD